MGFYSPSIGWNRAALFETDSFDLWLKNAKAGPLMGNNEIVLLV